MFILRTIVIEVQFDFSLTFFHTFFPFTAFATTSPQLLTQYDNQHFRLGVVYFSVSAKTLSKSWKLPWFSISRYTNLFLEPIPVCFLTENLLLSLSLNPISGETFLNSVFRYTSFFSDKTGKMVWLWVADDNYCFIHSWNFWVSFVTFWDKLLPLKCLSFHFHSIWLRFPIKILVLQFPLF